jgi:hypothetical protein
VITPKELFTASDGCGLHLRGPISFIPGHGIAWSAYHKDCSESFPATFHWPELVFWRVFDFHLNGFKQGLIAFLFDVWGLFDRRGGESLDLAVE